MLRLPCLRQGLQAARPEAHPHKALHAKNKRKGRTIHPDRFEGVGLRPILQFVTTTRTRPAALDAHLQLA